MDKLTILCVDDEPDALQALKIGLEEYGYTVLTAASGEEALTVLKTAVPDLIIADLRMQPMNGFELYQEVKKQPQFVTMPFFFLTAVEDYLAQKYSQTLGVDAYITKPIDLNLLDTMIKEKIKTTR